LEKLALYQDQRCVFLQITNEEKGLAYCSEYNHRPFVCRVFGVAARKNKHDLSEYSICSILKESSEFSTLDIIDNALEIPYISEWKHKLELLDPRLGEKEIPINQGLFIILEKLLLLKSFE
jgi:Fe-S-cluster containining protein